MKTLAVILICCLAFLSYFAWERYEFSRWQSREFRALTPGQHYLRARWLLCISSGFEPSESDLEAAVLHLEAIVPGDSTDPMVQKISQQRDTLLPLLSQKLGLAKVCSVMRANYFDLRSDPPPAWRMPRPVRSHR